MKTIRSPILFFGEGGDSICENGKKFLDMKIMFVGGKRCKLDKGICIILLIN